MTDREKPVILAKIYAYFLGHEISIEDFFLLARCIDICSLAELCAFMASRGATDAISDAGKVRLVTAGLVTAESTHSMQFPTLPKVSGNTLRMYFAASDLGNRLAYAIDAADTA